jgi:hypothetical protein
MPNPAACLFNSPDDWTEHHRREKTRLPELIPNYKNGFPWDTWT